MFEASGSSVLILGCVEEANNYENSKSLLQEILQNWVLGWICQKLH